MEINWLVLASYVVTILVEIGLPITLAVVIVRKFKVSWLIVLTGVLTFIGSQVVHIPLLQGLTVLFNNGTLPMPPTWILPYFNAILLGVLAGLCEETARLIGFKILKSKAKPFNSALALGIGHGGIESMIVGVMVLVSLVGGLSSSALAQAQIFSIPWLLPLAGGVERIMAITAQIFMSVLVWKAVVNHNYWWYVLAILFHTLLDFVAVYLSQLGTSTWLIEGAITGMAIFAAIMLWRTWVGERRKEKAAAFAEPGNLPETLPVEN